MNKRIDIKVANGVATVQDKRKYVSPEIEVVNLDAQPQLLSASTGGARGTAGWGNGLMDNDDEWSE